MLKLIRLVGLGTAKEQYDAAKNVLSAIVKKQGTQGYTG
jgi:hypothetical protein